MDSSVPATKADISMIIEAIGRLYGAIELWKNELHEEMDTELKKHRDILPQEMRLHKTEIKQHFDVTAENIQYDMRGAHKDKISVLNDRSYDHEQRIIVMEKQLAI